MSIVLAEKDNSNSLESVSKSKSGSREDVAEEIRALSAASGGSSVRSGSRIKLKHGKSSKRKLRGKRGEIVEFEGTDLSGVEEEVKGAVRRFPEESRLDEGGGGGGGGGGDGEPAKNPDSSSLDLSQDDDAVFSDGGGDGGGSVRPEPRVRKRKDSKTKRRRSEDGERRRRVESGDESSERRERGGRRRRVRQTKSRHAAGGRRRRGGGGGGGNDEDEEEESQRDAGLESQRRRRRRGKHGSKPSTHRQTKRRSLSGRDESAGSEAEPLKETSQVFSNDSDEESEEERLMENQSDVIDDDNDRSDEDDDDDDDKNDDGDDSDREEEETMRRTSVESFRTKKISTETSQSFSKTATAAAAAAISVVQRRESLASVVGGGSDVIGAADDYESTGNVPRRRPLSSVSSSVPLDSADSDFGGKRNVLMPITPGDGVTTRVRKTSRTRRATSSSSNTKNDGGDDDDGENEYGNYGQSIVPSNQQPPLNEDKNDEKVEKTTQEEPRSVQEKGSVELPATPTLHSSQQAAPAPPNDGLLGPEGGGGTLKRNDRRRRSQGDRSRQSRHPDTDSSSNSECNLIEQREKDRQRRRSRRELLRPDAGTDREESAAPSSESRRYRLRSSDQRRSSGDRLSTESAHTVGSQSARQRRVGVVDHTGSTLLKPTQLDTVPSSDVASSVGSFAVGGVQALRRNLGESENPSQIVSTNAAASPLTRPAQVVMDEDKNWLEGENARSEAKRSIALPKRSRSAYVSSSEDGSDVDDDDDDASMPRETPPSSPSGGWLCSPRG